MIDTNKLIKQHLKAINLLERIQHNIEVLKSYTDNLNKFGFYFPDLKYKIIKHRILRLVAIKKQTKLYLIKYANQRQNKAIKGILNVIESTPEVNPACFSISDYEKADEALTEIQNILSNI